MKDFFKRALAFALMLTLVFSGLLLPEKATAANGDTVAYSNSHVFEHATRDADNTGSILSLNIANYDYAEFEFSFQGTGAYGGGAVCYYDASNTQQKIDFSNEGATKVTVQSSDSKDGVIEVQCWWVNGTITCDYKFYKSGSSSGGSLTSGTSETVLPDYSNEVSAKTIPSNEAMDFVQGMTVGWNLGNQFDAANCSWLSNELDYESAWSGAKTTENLIESVQNAGFNTIRVAVSWHDHVDSNYNISSAWLNRVKQVVDWAYDRDMYVILNVHHDVLYNKYYSINSSYMNTSKTYMTKIWTQLCDTFGDYGEKLIFESINEPRIIESSGNEVWWINEGSTEYNTAMANINTLNQTFVNTVRSSGKKNGSRYLMIPSYATSQEFVVKDAFVMPTDTVSNRLIATAHMYLNYNFSQNVDGRTNFNSTDKNDNKKGFSDMYNKFIANGIPVVVGEFGAIDKGNEEDLLNYFSYVVGVGKAYGIRCVVWDNNAFNTTGTVSNSGNKFGLIDRATGNVIKKDIVAAMTQYYSAAVKFTTQPVDVTANIGDKVTFTAMADSDVTYQWQASTDGGKTWKASGLTGNKTSKLTVGATTGRDGYKFRCVAKDADGNEYYSSVATLTVENPIKITRQPSKRVMLPGKTAKFNVVTSNEGLTYQWQVSTDDGKTWKNSGLTGNKTATLSVGVTIARSGYKFRCVLKDAANNKLITDEVYLFAFGINTQPSSVSTSAGKTAKFTVAASGAGLTYQWQVSTDGGSTWKNSGMTGNKTKTLSVSATKARSGYKFRCVIKDKFGNSAKTSAVSLTVK